MTLDQVISDVLKREGGFVDDPADRGGATNMGITAAVLGEWRKLGRVATRAEVAALTEPEARAIYMKRYVIDPGFGTIADDALCAQLVDFGVVSGPARAIRWLQRVLNVPATGLMDAATKAAFAAMPSRLVNDALVAARLYMIDDITDGDATQKKYEEGWENRALAFFLSRPAA